MGQRLRIASKTFIDIVGHRGAQALSSVLILALVALGVDAKWIGLGIAGLATLAVGVALEMRPHYLNLFRTTLAEVARNRAAAFPELSLATLESLLATLNSSDDRRVEIALDLFAEQERSHLIPGLILYHPSPDVVAKALELLADSGRDDFLPLADRLLDHEYAHVRAAALRARMKIRPEEALLRRKLEVTCPVVRATALVGLTAGGYADIEETRPYLDKVIEEGSDVAKEALARAIGYGPTPAFDEYLVKLAKSDVDDVLLSVARSMARAPRTVFIESLLQMLPRRLVREAACSALVATGGPALAAMDAALVDPDVAEDVRRQLPRTIAMFDPRDAAAVLTQRLREVRVGGVRYRILRALNRLIRENPDLRIERKRLKRSLERNLSQAYQLLDWRLALARGAKGHAGRQTAAHRLLLKMLEDKRQNTEERMFRLLDVLYPSQDLSTISRGLRSRRAALRASSLELLESFVAPAYRAAVVGLVSDVSDEERLSAAGPYHQSKEQGYTELLRELLDSDSDSLRSLAVYHIGELGISELRTEIEAITPEEDGPLSAMVRQTVERLALKREVAT